MLAESFAASIPGTTSGRNGMCARGPHALSTTLAATAQTRVVLRKRLLHLDLRSGTVSLLYAVERSVPATSSKPQEVSMRKPRPNTYNPAQALNLIASDRTGSPLSCPSCSGPIERDPGDSPPPPRSHVTLRCTSCGRFARYIDGAT